MKKIWTMALSALLVLSLASCKQDTPDTPDIPVDTTLCAQTSAYLMAETETGFYYTTGNILYYADRADLTQWAPVCSRIPAQRRQICPAGRAALFLRQQLPLPS